MLQMHSLFKNKYEKKDTSVNIWIFTEVEWAIDKHELLEKFYVTIKWSGFIITFTDA